VSLDDIYQLVKSLGARWAVVLLLTRAWTIEPPGTISRSPMLAFRYLACLAGATVSYWWKPRAMRRRAIRLMGFLLLTVVFYLVYHFVTATPPAPEQASLFVDTAYASYILTSFCYGFCGAEGASWFWDAQAAKPKDSQHTV